MKELRERINELANKSKTIGLNDLEKKEQEKLRKEYIQRFRSSFKNTLLNTKVVDSSGKDVTPKKLKKEKNKKKKN